MFGVGFDDSICYLCILILSMTPQVVDIKEVGELKFLLSKSRDIVVTCHVSPDGDAIGASLALWHVFLLMGKRVTIVTPDQAPKSLSFLPGIKDIIPYSCYVGKVNRLFEDADLIICLDFNSLSRVDKLAEAFNITKAQKVMIDHHLYPDNFADIIISQPKMSSTCILLYCVLIQIGLKKYINKDVAECIYTGMMTDTGNFTYNSSDPNIYKVISELLEYGIAKDDIYTKVFNTNTESRLRLNGYAISHNMRIYKSHRAGIVTLSAEELNKYNYQKGDTEGVVNIPLSIPGSEYSAFFREVAEYIKVSMRSKGDFPVNTICEKYYNGGGHKNAAGGEFFGTLEEAVALFESLFNENDKYLSNENEAV